MKRKTFTFSVEVIVVSTDKETAKHDLESYVKHKNESGIEINDTEISFDKSSICDKITL